MISFIVRADDAHRASNALRVAGCTCTIQDTLGPMPHLDTVVIADCPEGVDGRVVLDDVGIRYVARGHRDRPQPVPSLTEAVRRALRSIGIAPKE